MKQNERLLVYAVTGFLALILVIAVLFGNDPANAAKKQENLSKGLKDILQPKDVPATDAEKVAAAAAAKAKADLENKADEHPLIAKPVLASAMVERTLGPSRRDRFVRFVPVKRGDAFSTIVSRWCGSTDPYLKEAMCLNEEVTMLRENTEVAVPWVDDEVLAAILEAQAPRTMINRSSGVPTTGSAAAPAGVPSANNGGNASSSRVGSPTFLMPGSATANASGGPAAAAPAAAAPAAAAPAAAAVDYTVKPGDSLWKIAAKKYGKRHADRMIRAIKQINPGLSDSLQIDQKLKLPAASE